MIGLQSIQVKAAFLLIVFSLNTIIGVACVCGINNSHHTDDAIAVTPGKIHEGCKKSTSRKEAKGHTDSGKDHNKSKEKNNCCADQVIEFNKSDKSFEHSFNAGINPTFFTVFVSAFYNIMVLYTSYINANIKYFVRSYHPPIPDIRIAIQSFQI